jgi:hypothetical protein
LQKRQFLWLFLTKLTVSWLFVTKKIIFTVFLSCQIDVSMVICCQIDSSYCHLLQNRQFIWLFVATSAVYMVICCKIGSFYGNLLQNRQLLLSFVAKSAVYMVICCQIDSSYCHLLQNRQFIWLFVSISAVYMFFMNLSIFWTTGNKSYNVQFEIKPHGRVSGRQPSTLNHEGSVLIPCDGESDHNVQQFSSCCTPYSSGVWKASVFNWVCHWYWHEPFHF